MDILNYILSAPELVIAVVLFIFTIIYLAIERRMPSEPQSALVKGLTQNVVDILLLIFSHTEYNYKEYNKTLKNPVTIDLSQPEGNQKMQVAIQAVTENLPKKVISKYGNIATFVQFAYNILKPLFKAKKK